VKKKRKLGLLRPSRSFKVIERGTNRKPVCDFLLQTNRLLYYGSRKAGLKTSILKHSNTILRLLVINSNRHPISYRFGVIAAYCSNFGHFAFLSPLWWLRDKYDVYLGLIGKRVLNFPISVNWTFSLGATSDALRAKIDRKSAISLQIGQFNAKF